MKAGVALFFTQYSISPSQLAIALEERGFESLWAPEHSHIPFSRNSDFPKGGELPEKYQDVMDPFVTLSVAAAVTTSLKIATGICLVVQRDPIQTAKSVASLDQTSSGRFLFGVGAGWNAEEMENHGTNFKSRMPLLKERIEAEIQPQENEELVEVNPVCQEIEQGGGKSSDILIDKLKDINTTSTSSLKDMPQIQQQLEFNQEASDFPLTPHNASYDDDVRELTEFWYLTQPRTNTPTPTCNGSFC